MALSPRLIRRRIRSVGNTKKITKAMELVAAAKMRRAVAAALKTRAYANLAWGMIGALEGLVGEALHPLLRSRRTTTTPRGREPERVLYIVMASDRGLCGGFNTALFRELLRNVAIYNDGERYDNQDQMRIARSSCIAIGKKSEQVIRRKGWELVASFTNVSVAPTVAELRPVARMAMDAFTSGQVQEVRIAFTDFISSLRQQPRVRTLLPLQQMEEVGPAKTHHAELKIQNVQAGFLFEPNPQHILDAMLPRLVELQVYQCYLETGASEHSARMLAMRNASESAEEMINDLTLTFNQARQAMITREIAEISAGRAALSTSSS